MVDASRTAVERVDTLIVGAGPIGLLLANQLLRFKTSVIQIEKEDKDNVPIYGRACTLWCRTLELLDQLDLAEPLMNDGVVTKTGVNYKNGKPVPGGLSFGQNLHKHADTRFNFSLHIRQRIIERYFEEALAERHDFTPRHQQSLVSFTVDESLEYPVRTTIKNEVTGKTYEVESKYIVGADGGKSTVRRESGIPFNGTRTGNKWIRIDASVKTNMPSPRTLNSVQSSTHGLVLWCPIDQGKIRIGYVFSKELVEKYGEDGVTGEVAMAEAKKAVAPFSLEFEKLDWFTLYGIGQAMAEKFISGRVILAGDACHTHSSGSAQGLNTGVLDAVNLGWKLAYKLRGLGTQQLLDTYDIERRYAVNTVIENDKIISTLTSGQLPPKFSDRTETPHEILDQWFDNAKVVAFTLGLGVSYEVDNFLNRHVPRGLLSGIEPGERAPEGFVTRLGTNERIPIQRLMPNDGTFYVTVFAGVPFVTQAKLTNFRNYLDKVDEPTWANSFPRGVIKTVTVLGAGGVAAGDAMGGLKSFGKTYYDANQEAHQSYGVDPMQGALIVIRPDGYLGHVVPLDQPEALLEYFQGFLIPTKQQSKLNGSANGHA